MPRVPHHPLEQIAQHLHWQHGVDVHYPSPAVAVGARSVESIVHELAHAAVLRVPFGCSEVTNRVSALIMEMSDRAQDRNEALSLAVEMVVLAALEIPVRHRTLVRSVEWKTTRWLSELPRVLALRERPSTQRHAAAIVRFLHRTAAAVAPYPKEIDRAA